MANSQRGMGMGAVEKTRFQLAFLRAGARFSNPGRVENTDMNKRMEMKLKADVNAHVKNGDSPDIFLSAIDRQRRTIPITAELFYGIPCRPFTRTRPGSEPSASHMSTGPIKLVL